jgi:DNA-binding CsgD family transcriptional regulator
MRRRPLTPRERQIINCIMHGIGGNKEIGKELKISPSTAKAYKRHIFDLLDIDNRWHKAVRLVWLVSTGEIRL